MSVCKCIYVYVYMCAYVYICISYTSYLYIQKLHSFPVFCAITSTATSIKLLLQLSFFKFFLNYFNLKVTFKKSFKIIIILKILNQISLSRQ